MADDGKQKWDDDTRVDNKVATDADAPDGAPQVDAKDPVVIQDPNVKPLGYVPPTSAEELLERYAKGERYFVGAELGVGNFVNAHLVGANLSDSILTGAQLEGANLHGAFLDRARMGADLQRTNLSRARLKGTDFAGALFGETFIADVDFSGARLEGIEHRAFSDVPSGTLRATAEGLASNPGNRQAVEHFFRRCGLADLGFLHSTKLVEETTPRLPQDVHEQVVQTLKALLRKGLPSDFVNNCVHVGRFQKFGGGIKSSLVGGLRIDVNAAIKLEDHELERHRLIMQAVNTPRLKVFPGVLDLVKLDEDRYLLLMEQLLGYETLLDSIFLKSTNLTDIDLVIDKTFHALGTMWRQGKEQRERLADVKPWGETLVGAIRRKLDKVFVEDPDLQVVMEHEGTVDKSACPPLNSVLKSAEQWLAKLTGVPRLLCHGDFHWRNIMSRKTKRGTSLRFIDPKPSIGYADPVVDLGMLYHWAEPLGWAQVDAQKHCRSEWKPGDSSSGWESNAQVENTSAAAEDRRQRALGAIERNLQRSSRSLGPEWKGRLLLSRALAHAGLAAVSRGDDGKTVRRFALGFCLASLAEWSTERKVRA